MKKISRTLHALINILNTGEVHSGENLAAYLQLSRNAIWKHIKQLQKLEVPVESLTNKGYRLNQAPLFLLDELALQAAFPDIPLQVLGSIPSTQTAVRNLAPFAPLCICLAEHQTAGMGRFHRQWHSAFGQNLYLSLKWRFPKDLSALAGLSLAISTSLVCFLEAQGLTDLKIKWPNDLFYQDEKLAGILIDAHAQSHGDTEVIIGIGLNINTKDHMSVLQITGEHQNRTEQAIALITQLIQDLAHFTVSGFSYFIDRWQAHDYLANQAITFQTHDKTQMGIARGVNAVGHLQVETPSGLLQTFSTGDASLVRKTATESSSG